MNIVTNLVINAIQQTRYNREEGRFQSFDVIH